MNCDHVGYKLMHSHYVGGMAPCSVVQLLPVLRIRLPQVGGAITGAAEGFFPKEE